MKFIRFGELQAFDQIRYQKCPGGTGYPHDPPRPRGFFAFPYAFFDRFYLMCHPAREAHSEMMYLRDGNGRKLTDADRDVLSETETEWCDETRSERPKVVRTMTDTELLRTLGLPKQPVMREDRPSWVCVMKDPLRPPMLAGDGQLDQEFEYLTDRHGERIPAGEFFRREWWPADFDGAALFEPCRPDNIRNDALYLFGLGDKYDPIRDTDWTGGTKLTLAHLQKRGIGVGNLFAWPVYPPGEEVWLTLFKTPHLFDYDGCVWHHLRPFVPRRAVLADYGTTWVYTPVRDFGRALRRAEPRAYGRQRASRGTARANRFGGPYCYNATFSPEGMYEVFFDEEDIKKIT